MHACVFVCMSGCNVVCMHVYTHTDRYVYVYIYIHTDIQL